MPLEYDRLRRSLRFVLDYAKQPSKHREALDALLDRVVPAALACEKLAGGDDKAGAAIEAMLLAKIGRFVNLAPSDVVTAVKGQLGSYGVLLPRLPRGAEIAACIPLPLDKKVGPMFDASRAILGDAKHAVHRPEVLERWTPEPDALTTHAKRMSGVLEQLRERTDKAMLPRDPAVRPDLVVGKAAVFSRLAPVEKEDRFFDHDANLMLRQNPQIKLDSSCNVPAKPIIIESVRIFCHMTQACFQSWQICMAPPGLVPKAALEEEMNRLTAWFGADKKHQATALSGMVKMWHALRERPVTITVAPFGAFKGQVAFCRGIQQDSLERVGSGIRISLGAHWKLEKVLSEYVFALPRTLYHELSHAVLNTDDIVNVGLLGDDKAAYGEAKAKKLATGAPELALKNADNFGLFAESAVADEQPQAYLQATFGKQIDM